jgi:Family of unknown function (DUF6526)
MADQNYKNHRRLIPLFHGAVLLTFALNVIWAGYRLVTDVSLDRLMNLLMAVALILMALFARTFALRVQDRVIRLEMRLRLRELLPADLHARIHELSVGQLVALRFASDQELPALAASVLNDRITDMNRIKQMVTSWQADELRA